MTLKASVSAGSSAGRSTRRQLIAVGERLFADQGIDHVSARQIAVACGQTNHRVVQYHFGSKDGLIEAILERRLAEIEERRLPLVQALQGGEPDVKALFDALLRPRLELPSTQDGHMFARLMIQCRVRFQRFDVIYGKSKEVNVSPSRWIYDQLRERLPGLARDQFDFRLRSLSNMFDSMLIERDLLHLDDRSQWSDVQFMDEILSIAVGMFQVPCFRQTSGARTRLR